MDRGRFLIDSLTTWVGGLGLALRNIFASHTADDRAERDQTTDPEFHGWVANDPMVTLNPASRYGDDATGFLAGSEADNAEIGGKDG